MKLIYALYTLLLFLVVVMVFRQVQNKN